MSVRSAVLRSGAPDSDEGAAAVSAAFAITGAAGGMAALIAVASGGIPFVVVPTIVLLGTIVAGRPGFGGLAGIAVWLWFVPMAHAEAMIAPLTMTILCTAIAVGPEQLFSWVRDDWNGREVQDASMSSGWIEDRP